MSLLGRLHGGFVHTRRVTVLARHLARLLPPDAHVLDVGCGDGILAARLRELRPDIRIEGVDVLVRPHTAIPVRPFDGVRIPYGDRSIDVVLMVDVLHHTDDPTVLLRESARVARLEVLIKDHLREGFAARLTLRGMDWVGNARHGVRLPYTYLSRAEWDRAFDQSRLVVRRWESALHLYPRPASWVFDRSLHFIAALGVERC
jgi:SAM-dependent methyltransferase